MAGRSGISRLSDGASTLDVRLGQQGDTMVSELHGRYYEQAVRKQMFFSYCAAQPTSVVTTAMIGNLIYNPPDSGVNLAMGKWSSAIAVTSATTLGIVLAAGYQATTPTTVTAATATGSTFLTQPTLAAGKAKAYSVATVLIAPVAVYLMHHNTAAIGATGVDQLAGDLEGSLVVPPGGFICVAALTAAVAAAGHYSYLSWEEVPVV
jgi:hypothetical protein